MKNLHKMFAALLVVLLGVSFAFAGGTKEKAQNEFELTDEQKAEGWRYFMPIGIKIHRPAFWDKYDDNMWVDEWGDDYDTPEKPLFRGVFYLYMSEKATAEFKRLRNEKFDSQEAWMTALKKDVFPILKPVYGLFAFRTELIKDKDIVQLVSSEITEYPVSYQKAKILQKGKEYTQVLGYNDFSADNLTEEEAAVYREMISQVLPAAETITCTKPKLVQDVFAEMKNIKFDTVDLDGKQVTSDIFKDYDVTMVNIWATWCGWCVKEMPDIAKVYEAFKDKNCNVIGLTGDVSPDKQEMLGKAKEIAQKAGCRYTLLQKNETLNPIFKYVSFWPMTFFVDKKGNVIAESRDDILAGSWDLDTFTQAMNKALDTVNKK